MSPYSTLWTIQPAWTKLCTDLCVKSKGSFINDVIYFWDFWPPPSPSWPTILIRLMELGHLLADPPSPLLSGWHNLWTAPKDQMYRQWIQCRVETIASLTLNTFRSLACYWTHIRFVQELFNKKKICFSKYGMELLFSAYNV